MNRVQSYFSAKHAGAAVLILVLVLGAVALTIATSLALGSVGELSMGFSDVQSKKSLDLADSCAQEGLLKLWDDLAYSGETFSMGEGTCTMTVTTIPGGKQIDAEATYQRWVTHTVVTLDITGTRLQITNWQHN